MEAANDNLRLMSIRDVCSLTSLSRSAINAYRERGTFPMAVELGAKRIAFLEREVREWIEARVAARGVAA